jgi:SAM-dependent methyltransferase
MVTPDLSEEVPMTPDAPDPQEVARFEHATWTRCADSYADGFGPLTVEAIGPLLDEARVTGGARVLDLGTGPGFVAASAHARGADALGLDFSEAMVETARRLHPGVAYQVASADSLPLGDGSFDAVVSNFMLHHTAHPDAVLREACRVLRPGGRFAFTVWADLARLEAFGLFLAAVEEQAGAAELPHGPLFGVSDEGFFLQMMREAGFAEAAVRELPVAWRTSSLDSYLSAFRDWADLATFPPDVRGRIEHKVREGAAAYRVGEEFVMPNPAVLVSGVR